MAIYSYTGMDKNGREIKASINIETLHQAKARIRSMGIMLIKIKEEKSSTQEKSPISLGLGKRISTQDIALMTRQFAVLLRAKIQVVECLNALVEQTEHPRLKIVLAELKQSVNEGHSLAHSLKEHPKVFSTVYANMVEAGEASGTLEVVLLRLADFTEAQVQLQRKIKGAMTYPLIMMAVGAIMVGIIFVFVIPKITRIFISMKRELPLQTKICIAISNFLTHYWWLVILGLVGGWYLFNRWIKTKGGEAKWHKILLKMPIAAELVIMINIGRFCSTLATLIASGVPILVSMRIVKNLVSNVHMRRAVEESQELIREGASMITPLVKSGYFPPMVTHMIGLGEKSGEIGPMLKIVAQNYEDQVESKLSGLTSTLEPIMMVGMGVVVAFVVFSVVVPIMELNTIQ